MDALFSAPERRDAAPNGLQGVCGIADALECLFNFVAVESSRVEGTRAVTITIDQVVGEGIAAFG